jgi:hypothetical protein
MRTIYILTLLTIICKGACANPVDTIANWQIYYGDILILKGNELGHVDLIIENLKIDKSKRLKIYYRYDAAKPEWKQVIIKTKTETLYDQTQYLKDNHPHLIDLHELDFSNDGRVVIEIYYTDNISKVKNRLIGTIKITK